MALITNNISGSSTDSWRIGITGSVRIGNPGSRPFPSMPGNDVDFFVSGSRGGKGSSGVSVFGGDTVVSGTLVIGTGSIEIDSNEIRFQGGLPKIYSGSTGLIFEDASGAKALSSLATTATFSSFFTSTQTNAIYTTGSVAIRGNDTGIDAAEDKGTDVIFYVSGALGASPKSALFGGAVVSSGSVNVKDGSGSTVVSLTNAGIISGSGNLQAGGSLTVAGTSTLVGNVTVSGDVAVNGGDITTTSATGNIFNANATTVNIAGAATSLTLGATPTATTTIRGGTLVGDASTQNLFNTTATTVNFAGAGTDISVGAAGSGTTFLKNANTNVSGALVVAGAINANNGTIATNQSSFNLVNTNATTVNFAGAGTAVNIGATTGTTTVRNNLVVKGDLYVSGTTTTIDSTVMEIQDPVIGLGFASGSVAGTPGDRGFIGGITGAGNNVAFIWSNNSGSFIATKTSTGPGSAPVTVSALQPVRASKLEVGGTNAWVTSSDGSAIEVRATNAVNLNAGSGQAVALQFNGTTFAEARESGADVRFGAISGKNLLVSGSSVALNGTAGKGTAFQIDGVQYAEFLNDGTNAKFGATTGKKLTVSGSAVLINAARGSTNGFVVQADGLDVLKIYSGSSDKQIQIDTDPTNINNIVIANSTNTVNLGANAVTLNLANARSGDFTLNFGNASTGSSTYNIANGATANGLTKIINFGSNGVAGSTTNINIGGGVGGTTTITGSLAARGSITLGNTSADTITFTARANTDFLPSTDMQRNLGGPNLRWANVYTGDLHLRNDRGSWTIIEEPDFLTITNNLNGKKYKFVMEEI